MKKAKVCNKPLADSGHHTENTAAMSDQDVRALVEEILAKHRVDPPSEIIGFDVLVSRLPLSARSVRAEVKGGKIPHIRLPGARKLLFDWRAVQDALIPTTLDNRYNAL